MVSKRWIQGATDTERGRQLARLPEPFLKCRTYRHAWDGRMSWGATVTDKQAGTTRTHRGWLTEVKECGRCGAEVVTFWDGQLQLQGREMHYPKGYVITGQREDHPAVEARRELLRRAIDSEAAEA